jgi:hypothetical protein
VRAGRDRGGPARQHGLVISRASVRRLRCELGLAPRHRRRPPQARHRRVPEAARGALVQIDGSPFAWLEARGPQLMLLGAIDDATSEILALHFRPAEDVHGYTTLFQQLFTTHGLPLALYGDRLNLLVRHDPHWSRAEELAGTQHPTHLGRMLQDLGIGYVAAHSPQAKGRIERLWATLQDRLVSELRLRGRTTVTAATAYLPEFIADFNRRFGKLPATPQSVWRRPPPDLALVLSCRYRRIVARDNTVRIGPRCAQLRGGRSYAGLTVEARELLDGRLVVLHDGAIRAQAPAPSGPFVLKPRRAPNADRRLSRPRPAPRPALPRSVQKTHTGRRPLPTHPWVLANDRSVRRRELTTGRTFSRSSKGGHFHAKLDFCWNFRIPMICSSVNRFHFIAGPPRGHPSRADSHAAWTSFRGAGRRVSSLVSKRHLRERAGLGGLIQTSVGIGAGAGGPAGNRSGWAA